MKRAPRSRQRHDLYAKYHDYDSEISDLLGECGLRHYSVIEQRLATRSYILGSEYSIVDMAAWGWIRMADFVMGEGALEQFPHVGSWFGRINARPAAARAEELRKRHDFKTSWDDDARENMFRFQKAQART